MLEILLANNNVTKVIRIFTIFKRSILRERHNDLKSTIEDFLQQNKVIFNLIVRLLYWSNFAAFGKRINTQADINDKRQTILSTAKLNPSLVLWT